MESNRIRGYLERQRARASERAREYVFGSTRWLNVEEIEELIDSRPNDPRALPSTWKREREIFALHVDGVERFPIYLLDPDDGFRPRPVVRKILDAFGDQWTDWELANWFASANGYLEGKAPMDCLSGPSEMLIKAAKAAAGNYLHG